MVQRTMHITPLDVKYIDILVEKGHASSASDVVRQGIKMVYERYNKGQFKDL